MSSSDDSATLQSIGHDIVQYFVAVTVETFLVAVYSVLVWKTTHLLLRKHRTRVSVLTWTGVFIMYGLALSLWMIDIHNIVIEVEGTLLSTVNDSLANLYSSTMTEVLRLAAVEDYLYAYMSNVGDSIIIWRVYAFWSKGRERLVLLIPLAFLLGSISTSMMLTYCATTLGADIELGAFRNPAFCRNIQTASYSMTLATTGVATILIAWKTWEYRRIHMEAFGKLSHMTSTQKIMVMLVESGVLYMLFFLVQVIGSLQSVNDSIDRHPVISFGFTVYDFMTSLIVGMYPTVVVLLVNSRHSVLRTDTDGVSAHGGIAFKASDGSGATGSTFLDSTSSGTATATRQTRAAKTVNLYEMARMPSAGSGDMLDLKRGGHDSDAGLEGAVEVKVDVETHNV